MRDVIFVKKVFSLLVGAPSFQTSAVFVLVENGSGGKKSYIKRNPKFKCCVQGQ